MQKNFDKSILIWAVTDNKLGHINQIEGLITALTKYRSTHIHWINVNLQTKPLQSLYAHY